MLHEQLLIMMYHGPMYIHKFLEELIYVVVAYFLLLVEKKQIEEKPLSMEKYWWIWMAMAI